MSRPRSIARWLLPAAPAYLAGAYLAGLLFFVNPELAFSPGALARGALYYGTLALGPALVAHVLVARSRGVAVGRLVPWSLTVVAALGAIGDGLHASRYAFLLPEAINRQLIKSALWLAFAAVLMFYTALLHSLHGRRYGARSRILLALVAAGSIYAMFERRTSYRESVVAPPEIAVDPDFARPRLVVVAVPTATLDAVLPLARQGKLPFLAQLLDQGAAARLAAPSPARGVALWTSWATGKLPFRHRVVGTERWRAPLLGAEARLSLAPLLPGFRHWGLPGGGRVGLEPDDRQALAIWEILRRSGHPSLALGFPLWLGGTEAPRVASPPSPVARELATLGRAALADWLEVDRARLAAARAQLAGAGEPPVTLFVLLPGLEVAARATYGGFSAVAFEGARSAAATAAAHAFELYLAALDAELAALWDSLAPPRLLAVTSPYGISAPRGVGRLLRAVLTSDLELRGTLGGDSDGMLLVAGAGIRPGQRIPEGRVADVAPTLLYGFGLPLARDFDGRVFTEAFDPATLQRRALSFVPSFEGLPQR